MQLNCQRDEATLVLLIRKRFDVLAEGLDWKNNRGDRSAIELFVGVVSSWEAELRRSTLDHS